MRFTKEVFVLLIFCSAEILCNKEEADFYSFTVKDILGNDFDLEKLRGTVTLAVNVASECGYTDAHYKGLTKMQESLGQDGKFQVLGFPCNQFGRQEPGTPEEIIRFTHENYGINFQLLEKSNVFGNNANPAFKYLIDESGKSPDWNFWKYLVGPDGRVVKAWNSRYTVDMIFDDVKREVTKAGEDIRSTLEKKELNLDEL